MSVVIRFGYCPPSPGPYKFTGCKWYTNIKDAVEAYNNYHTKPTIYISYNKSLYREISYYELISLNDD